MPTLYGMVTVGTSSQYTKVALDSFFKHTKLGPGDMFCLIDNDGHWIQNFTGYDLPFGQLIKNEFPKNTAENINQLIEIALSTCSHLVFLNNDVIFTPNWSTRIIINDTTMSIASCNQIADYGFPPSTDLSEFNDRYSKLNAASHVFHSTFSKPFERLIMPTFVCRMPFEILSTVGYFDEEFYVGGEDVDYRLRLLNREYDVKYSSAYLLHFNGKSSWNGPESKKETETRNSKYFEVFSRKWGGDLANLCLINGDPEKIIRKHELFDLLYNNRYNDMIVSVMKSH